MIGWIITGAIALPFVILSIFLLNGKGAFLIAGYNTMSDDKKILYNEKALCKAVGKLLLSMAVFMMLFPITIQFEIMWLFWLSFIAFMVLPIGFAIYANTGGRYIKEVIPFPATGGAVRKPMTRSKKLAIIIGIVLSAQLCIGIGIMIYQGERDPRVSIVNNSVRISALYGTDISIESISGITLIPQSMREIGIGRRTNGYETSGQALKGTFSSQDRGPQLLFVYSSSSPTIRIEVVRGYDIFISYRDGETTKAIYSMLSSTFAHNET